MGPADVSRRLLGAGGAPGGAVLRERLQGHARSRAALVAGASRRNRPRLLQRNERELRRRSGRADHRSPRPVARAVHVDPSPGRRRAPPPELEPRGPPHRVRLGLVGGALRPLPGEGGGRPQRPRRGCVRRPATAWHPARGARAGTRGRRLRESRAGPAPEGLRGDDPGRETRHRAARPPQARRHRVRRRRGHARGFCRRSRPGVPRPRRAARHRGSRSSARLPARRAAAGGRLRRRGGAQCLRGPAPSRRHRVDGARQAGARVRRRRCARDAVGRRGGDPPAFRRCGGARPWGERRLRGGARERLREVLDRSRAAGAAGRGGAPSRRGGVRCARIHARRIEREILRASRPESPRA